MKTKIIPAGVFKARCLAILDEVQTKCEPVIITKRGRPVAKLVPVAPQSDDLFGFFKGRGRVLGDIISPAIPAEDWEFD
jgi:prevent-host-death family protein